MGLDNKLTRHARYLRQTSYPLTRDLAAQFKDESAHKNSIARVCLQRWENRLAHLEEDKVHVADRAAAP